MRATQCGDDVLVPLLREDRLETEFAHVLLGARLADGRVAAGAGEERAGSLGVP